MENGALLHFSVSQCNVSHSKLLSILCFVPTFSILKHDQNNEHFYFCRLPSALQAQ